MNRRFTQVDQRLAQVDQNSMQVERQFTTLHAGLEQIVGLIEGITPTSGTGIGRRDRSLHLV